MSPRATIAGLAAAVALTAACGQREQASACAAFVACVEARDAQRGTETDVARFAAGGACWSAAEEGALSCARACERGLEVAARLPDAPEACR